MREQELQPGRGGRLIRPSRVAMLLVPTAIALELVGRLLSSSWVTLAAAGLLGALLTSAALTPPVRGVTVTREAPARMSDGIDTVTRLRVVNPRRWRSIGPLLLVDENRAVPAATVWLPRLAPGGAAIAEVSRTPYQRGYWPGGSRVTVEGCSPLGGFRRCRTFSGVGPTVVHPAPARALPLPDRSPADDGLLSGSGRAGRGDEVFGLREWRSGDAAAAVNWRASARRGRLVVLERERPAVADVVVALGQAGSGDRWEDAIARAAATAVAAYRAGRRVTLLAGTVATAGTSVTSILDWFASADEAGAVDEALFGRTLLPTGSLVVWLSVGEPGASM